MDYRLEVKEVEKEGGEEKSISSTRKTVRKIDNAKDTFQVQERGRGKESQEMNGFGIYHIVCVLYSIR